MKKLIIIFFILFTVNIFGQKNLFNDSCKKAEQFNLLAEKTQLTNSDSSIRYSQKALELSEKCGDNNLKARSLLNLATALDLGGSYSEALKKANNALHMFKANTNSSGEAKSLYRIGKIYFHQSECTNDQSNKTDYYNESLNYYQLALNIERKQKNISGIADNTIEIGRVLFSLQKPDSALKILKNVLTESEQNKIDPEFIHNVAKSSYNIALIYIDQDSLLNAIHFLTKAASADSILNNKEGLAVIRIAEMYLRMGNASMACQLAEQSLDTALKYGFPLRVMQASEVLNKALSAKGDFKDAYRSLLVYNRMNDSLKNDKYVKELTQLKMKNEFEKEQERKELENKARLEKQKLITYSVIAILILLILFLIYGIKTYRQKQRDNILLAKQKKEIEEKNEILNQQNEEITSQRDEIEAQRDTVIEQKNHIEEQKKEITDSINYAKRIQTAMLPSGEYAEEILGEHFIFFRPKDIVSGDFYWATKINNWIIVTVADCTGHGVPGAFMSMLGVSFLNEIIRKKEITMVSEVLDNLRNSIIEALKQKGTSGEQKDGMDIALCAINTENNTVQFAGGNNPLFIVNSRKELVIIEPDKQPVAIYENMKPFTNKFIQVEKGDVLYLASDGYEDQFGGPSNKKFKIKQLRELLVNIADKSMEEQLLTLSTVFENWKSTYEQIDDVTVLGIRI